MDRTYAPTAGAAFRPSLAMIFMMAEPTMAPSDRSAIRFPCSGVEMPKPTAQGISVLERISRTMLSRSVVISLRVPVTPRLDTM